jgi:hypothetical protein
MSRAPTDILARVRRGVAIAGVLLAALVAAGAARADDRYDKWQAGGALTMTPLEQRLAVVASEIAGRPASVICFDHMGWDAFMKAIGKDPDFTGGTAFGGSAIAFLTWSVCPSAYEPFLANPQRSGTKECQTGTRTEYTTETRTETRTETTRQVVYDKVRARVKTKGKWKWVTVKKRRVVTVETQVPVEVQVQVPTVVPVLGKCSTYDNFVYALAVLTHESAHLRDSRYFADEALTECYAVQRIAQTAYRLGASKEFALEIGADYLDRYMATKIPRYWSADCRDGGPMDLYPAFEGWPAPLATIG